MSESYEDAIVAMPREVYDRMVDALSLGKWPDGRSITDTQRIDTMKAVILWGQHHLPEDQRIGFIDKGSKAGSLCDDPVPIKWQ
jgi:uncharacterized protein YeaC (DUF1315 family)